MSTIANTIDFFVDGGTLKANAPSYIERLADEELYQAVKRGLFCYVLTARQMGKSSLMVRTSRRLKVEGVETAIIDLTQIGVTAPETWYFDFVSELSSGLHLKKDVEAWWYAHSAQGYVLRFKNFLRDVVLDECKGNIVIFVDEIDFTLSLDFRDEFFAAIRAVYNNRARDTNFSRLTFVLMGVAAPSDLIKDQTHTPFNVGTRVELEDFSRDDITQLQPGLDASYPGQSAEILTRVFYWTGGHPYLTQKLCKAEVEADTEHWSEAQTDQLVNILFLRKEASKENNLEYVRKKILNRSNRRELLQTYKQVYRGRLVVDNERSPVITQLKLTGLIKSEGGYLKTRNEIYRRVFDEAWIKTNTAVDWYRLLTIIFGIILVPLIMSLLYNLWQTEKVDDAALAFYTAQTPEEQLSYLHTVFNPPGLARGNSINLRGREMFYSLSLEEQLALFENSAGAVEIKEQVIEEIYETLADTDSSNSTKPILEAMRDVFAQDTPYYKEINSWLQGREMRRLNMLDEALVAYNAAIEANSGNPATLFERAEVFADVGRLENAARDLDAVVGLAITQQAPTPVPNNVPSNEQVSIQTAVSTMTAIATGSPLLEEEINGSATPLATPPGITRITSEFQSGGEMIVAVREMILDHPDLHNHILTRGSDYPNLQEFINLPQTQPCDPSYPDVCIPSPPPDLDCSDISFRGFQVIAPDPHNLDPDQDGIGCEAR